MMKYLNFLHVNTNSWKAKFDWKYLWVGMVRKGCSHSAGISLLKVNSRNTRTRYEICSKLTIKKPERCQWRCSGFFIVNFEHISHLVALFLLFVNFENAIASWPLYSRDTKIGCISKMNNRVNDFLHRWCNFRKAKSYSNNFWMVMIFCLVF